LRLPKTKHENIERPPRSRCTCSTTKNRVAPFLRPINGRKTGQPKGEARQSGFTFWLPVLCPFFGRKMKPRKKPQNQFNVAQCLTLLVFCLGIWAKGSILKCHITCLLWASGSTLPERTHVRNIKNVWDGQQQTWHVNRGMKKP